MHHPRFLSRRILLVGLALLLGGCGDDDPAGPGADEFQLISPNGGEIYAVGMTAEIRWSAAADQTGFEILFSSDGGSSFDVVEQNVERSPYSWTLPDGTSDACAIRVRHIGSASAVTSAAFFRITELTFSKAVQPQLTRSCLTDCHSTEVAAAGLDLSSWDSLILGSRNGDVMVPFQSEESHMVHMLRGMMGAIMPSHDLLSASEVALLAAWIDAGARNDKGESPYQDSRRKIYVANQGSDEVSVLDLDALVVFRIVTVGASPNLEGPHNLWIDATGERWYVTLINSGELWQYDTATDEFLGKAVIGGSPANGVTTSDGSRVYVTNWDQRTDRAGTVLVVDAASMSVIDTIVVGGRPHGIAISTDGTRLYTTNYYTDDISIVDLTLPEPEQIGQIPMANDVNPLSPLSYQPTEIIPSPDGRFLYVTLFQIDRKELRVLDLAGDSLYAVIPTGGSGFLEEITPDGTQLYVADWGSNTVSIIDTGSLSLQKILSNDNFSKPHGVAFSPDGSHAFVTSENRDGTAPTHHPTSTGLGSGNIAIIDTATQEVVKVIELESVSAGIAVLTQEGL